MEKTFYYNFIPSKAEEEALKANNVQHKVTRTLVEIHRINPPPIINYYNPWSIKKKLIHYEVVNGKILISFCETFRYIFRYWTLNMSNLVVLGNKLKVALWDVTDINNLKRYHDAHFEMMPNDDYALMCIALFKDRGLNVANEIGLFWDPMISTFQLKLLLPQKS